MRRPSFVRRRASAFAFAFPVLACLATAQTPDDPAPTPPAAQDAARVLFDKNCASCHGTNGDGKGTTVLERPARSFKDGGFSYGNTKETIARTLAHGIPGTPMPSFGAALKPDELALLADYVIALGPPQAEVKRSDTLLVVRDVPLFARGKLPPLVDGAPETVRGLLVGTPDGLTFQLDVEELRLLGVRQGEFVERKDWGGRGGSALVPLGKLVYDCGVRGKTKPTFSTWNPLRNEQRSLPTRLRGTQVWSGSPRVYFAFETGSAVLETGGYATFGGRSASYGSGFSTALRLEQSPLAVKRTLRWTLSERSAAAPAASSRTWCVRALDAGAHELHVLLRADPGDSLVAAPEGVVAELAPRSPIDVEVVTLLLPTWDDAVRAQLEQEITR